MAVAEAADAMLPEQGAAVAVQQLVAAAAGGLALVRLGWDCTDATARLELAPDGIFPRLARDRPRAGQSGRQVPRQPAPPCWGSQEPPSCRQLQAQPRLRGCHSAQPSADGILWVSSMHAKEHCKAPAVRQTPPDSAQPELAVHLQAFLVGTSAEHRQPADDAHHAAGSKCRQRGSLSRPSPSPPLHCSTPGCLACFIPPARLIPPPASTWVIQPLYHPPSRGSQAPKCTSWQQHCMKGLQHVAAGPLLDGCPAPLSQH